MKICYLGTDYPPTGGGIATYTKDWLEQISGSENLESGQAFIFGNKLPRREKLTNNFEVVASGSKGFFPIGFQIFKIFLFNKSDLFHALNLFPVGFWTVFWTKIFRRKSAVTFYGTDACSTEAKAITRKLKSWTLRNSNHAFTISEFTKNRSAKYLGVGEDRIEVIYPFVPVIKSVKIGEVAKDLDKLIKQSGLSRMPKFPVLSVCRLVKRKGIDYLIKAVVSIADPEVVLLIVGDGPERKNLEELTKTLNCGSKVKFLGKVENLDLLYRMAKVATLVSYFIEEEGDFEGLGLVLLEAQSYKIPVIGSRSGGIPEAFAPNDTGILVPEQDSKAIAEAILKLHQDNQLWQKFSGSTAGFLADRFSADKAVKRYFTLLKL